MPHFSRLAFFSVAIALATIDPIKSREIKQPSLAQELRELKRLNEENNRKIKILEARLNAKEEALSKTQKIKSTPQKVQEVGKTPQDMASQYSWPPHYISVPQTNSAVQLIINPHLEMSYDFGPFAGDFINSRALPLRGVEGKASKSGRFNIQARATQFGFRTLSHTSIGDIKTEIILDFYGNSDLSLDAVPRYQPRLRFAFIELLGFTIGQATSNFLDTSAIGETVDFGTIWGGAFRHPLIKYMFQVNKQTSLGLAIERSVTDYTNNTGTLTSANSATSVPDFTAHLKYADSFGHVALRGVLRDLKLKNISDAGQPPIAHSAQKLGWGLGLSGKFFIHGKTNLFAQVHFGDGIGRFIILCNGQSAFYDQTTGIFDRQKAADGIIGLEHFWTDTLRSNIIYAHTNIKTSNKTPHTAYVTKSINQFFLNLIYSPIPSLNFGVEYGHASRKTTGDKRGTANRITLGTLYKF